MSTMFCHCDVQENVSNERTITDFYWNMVGCSNGMDPIRLKGGRIRTPSPGVNWRLCLWMYILTANEVGQNRSRVETVCLRVSFVLRKTQRFRVGNKMFPLAVGVRCTSLLCGMRPDSLPRLWRYIKHLLSYLLTAREIRKTIANK